MYPDSRYKPLFLRGKVSKIIRLCYNIKAFLCFVTLIFIREINVGDIKKERLVISIATLAAIVCIIQNYIGRWEFWVPLVIIAGAVVLWWFHIAQKLDGRSRVNMCFAFSAFLMFYHGIHASSLFDVSVVVALFMAAFTIANSVAILNLILAEYVLVMSFQFYYLYQNGEEFGDAFTTMRIVFHVGTVLAMYLFSRITVNGRINENDRIQEWKRKVSENSRDMEDFLSNISHELRTPVNVISGMTTLLQKTDDSKELVTIQEAGIRLAYQIEDIQDYTEIKRGELVLEEENYMCISLINDVVTNYRAQYLDSGLELVVDLDPATPTMLYGDIKKLHKLFRHLISNAVKFTKRGGIFIRVFSVAQEYGCNLIIEITDTGKGMSRAQMLRLSSGMYQANKKRNRSTGGIGIGLPIVYGFVHKMGGFVKVESERARSTTVRISVPQTVVDPSPCLAVKDAAGKGIVFYIKPAKYKVPEIREFYRQMAVDLATGLKAKLYSVDEAAELERVVGEMEVTNIFTGQEEYEADKNMLDRLSREGHRVIVSARSDLQVGTDSPVTLIPKPLYGFPVVRILNGEEDIDSYGDALKGKPRFTGISALIVDDEPMNLVVAAGLLREYKMFADTAESGKDAIRKYEAGEYDIIFMDHMMPEMDGVEAMKRIRDAASEKGKNPIVIALTANALSGAREMFVKEGFDGFIAKPIDIKEFERVMKKVLPEEMIHYEGRAKE